MGIFRFGVLYIFSCQDCDIYRAHLNRISKCCWVPAAV
nr:MAG TPA: hypothetical protein [Caudoviricetes sp.]